MSLVLPNAPISITYSRHTVGPLQVPVDIDSSTTGTVMQWEYSRTPQEQKDSSGTEGLLRTPTNIGGI
jgi:hypothetical protein